MSKSNKVKIAQRPVFKRLVADTLRPPQFSEGEGNTEYQLNFVSPEGKANTVQCSKGVYQDVEKEKLYKNYRVQFHLLFDEEQEMITHINLKTKTQFLPAGFTEDDIVGSKTDVQHLEIGLSPDKNLNILRAPTTTASSTETEVLESLKIAPEDVKSGDYLQGKYRVVEIRERDGHKTFFIDPSVT